MQSWLCDRGTIRIPKPFFRRTWGRIVGVDQLVRKAREPVASYATLDRRQRRERKADLRRRGCVPSKEEYVYYLQPEVIAIPDYAFKQAIPELDSTRDHVWLRSSAIAQRLCQLDRAEGGHPDLMRIQAKRCQVCGLLRLNLLAQHRKKLDESAFDGRKIVCGDECLTRQRQRKGQSEPSGAENTEKNERKQMSTSGWTVSDSPTPPAAGGAWQVSDSPTPPAPSLTDNPNGEGVYQMRDKSGKSVGIPYSNITAATGQGHYFANPQEQSRYEKDNEADRKNTDPYVQQHYGITPGGVAKGGWAELLRAGKGILDTAAPPRNAGEALAGPALPLVRMGEGYVKSAGQGLDQARNYFKSGQPVRGAATVVGALNPLSSGPTASINQQADQGGNPGQIIGQGLADAGMAAAPELAKAVVPKIPPVAEKAAGGIMNRTVGALKNDFARGANPGKAYINSGAGPASSMDGLAEKAATVKDRVGSNLAKIYDDATASGKRIPVQDVRQAVNGVIDSRQDRRWHAVVE